MKPHPARALLVLLLGGLLAWAAPLFGLALAGEPLAAYLNFPPRTELRAHAAFSWIAFALAALPALGAAALYAVVLYDRPARPGERRGSAAPWPWWGWLGLALLIAAWAGAWSPHLLPEAWRRHTFAPLWLGYLVTVNALTYRRSGRCPLTDDTRTFLALFPASAAFWWLFEYLNQYTDNWHYTGLRTEGGFDYLVQATLPFSTVLPAVAGTRAYLATYGRLDGMRWIALRPHPSYAWLALGGGVLGLAGIGLWSDLLYPLLWVAPVLLLAGLQYLLLARSSFSPLTRGDWRPILQPALAALVCGLLWEMWNYWSLARWEYSVPYVDRFHIFQMPLLGYAGYLPFGVACALVIDLVRTTCGQRTRSSR